MHRQVCSHSFVTSHACKWLNLVLAQSVSPQSRQGRDRSSDVRSRGRQVSWKVHALQNGHISCDSGSYHLFSVSLTPLNYIFLFCR